ncbi:hypothetical protein MANES_02G093000v8 [Manihot esculenta]|uniref:Uncharacterized protein n=1 Tax=Manihot esculenta TaxID=3983 RepID=A0A2C9WCE0_MANES|nr:hypothetical protein MANES_02G093000v8 [Manihot esculenta]
MKKERRKRELHMITRSKLVEKLRDYQIRSKHRCSARIVFSRKPHITSCVVAYYRAIVKHGGALLWSTISGPSPYSLG